MIRLILASGNRHKVGEFRALARASAIPIELDGADAVGGMPGVVEDAGTFQGNAGKKARALWRRLEDRPSFVVADDSGLCVDALGGAPGVDSAYYAGPAGDPAANLAKLIEVMHDVGEGGRKASFICVLVAIDPQGNERVFAGRCRGRLLTAPRGGAGFGYDPLFVPDGHDRSFAELGEETKNRLSHRARAWAELVKWLGAG